MDFPIKLDDIKKLAAAKGELELENIALRRMVEELTARLSQLASVDGVTDSTSEVGDSQDGEELRKKDVTA